MADAKLNPPKSPTSSTLDAVRKLGALPKDEPEAPRGPLSHGAIPTDAEVTELAAKQKAATDKVDDKAAKADRVALERARAAQAELAEGAELPAEHAKVLARAAEIEKPAAELERLTVEQLGTEAGYLPQMWKSPMDMRTGRPRAVSPRPNPKFWIFAGAKAYHRWPIGKELTRAEFAAAVREAHIHPIR